MLLYINIRVSGAKILCKGATYAATISSVGYQTKYISEIVVTAGKTYYSEIDVIQQITSLNDVVIRSFTGAVDVRRRLKAQQQSKSERYEPHKRGCLFKDNREGGMYQWDVIGRGGSIFVF